MHALFELAVDVAKRSGDVGRQQSRRAGDRFDQARHGGRTHRLERQELAAVRAKNIAKTPLVGGQWRLRDGNKYDIVITDNKTAPEIPAGGNMEPIA